MMFLKTAICRNPLKDARVAFAARIDRRGWLVGVLKYPPPVLVYWKSNIYQLYKFWVSTLQQKPNTV